MQAHLDTCARSTTTAFLPAERWDVRQKLLLGHTPTGYLKSLLTPFNLFAALILAAGVWATWVRFTQGLASATNLSDDTPWGIWIGFDVLCGVALAAGGFCIAAAVHIFRLKEYHPLMRPAILTGFLGYFFVAVGLLFDLGRPWRLPYPIFVSHGTSSVMFEVAWCVALYLTVLFLEFAPALSEWLDWKRLRNTLLKLSFVLSILGVVLSTLHQSALGALFLIAPYRLHPLWYSAYIPVFFFISAVSAGLSMVIFESWASHKLFPAKCHGTSMKTLDGLTLGVAKAAALVLLTLFCLKWIGVAHDNRWAYLMTGYGAWFLFEIGGFVLLPGLAFVAAVKRRSANIARVAAVWAVLGVVLNRLNISIIAFNWQQTTAYVPHWMELVISLSIVVTGLLVFRFIVLRMPILEDASPHHMEG